MRFPRVLTTSLVPLSRYRQRDGYLFRIAADVLWSGGVNFQTRSMSCGPWQRVAQLHGNTIGGVSRGDIKVACSTKFGGKLSRNVNLSLSELFPGPFE